MKLEEIIKLIEVEYDVLSISEEDEEVVLRLRRKEVEKNDDNWVREHVEKCGKEPNLFDGV